MNDSRLERFKLFLNDPLLRQGKGSNLPINLQKSIEQVLKPEKTRPYVQYQQSATFNGNYNPIQEFQPEANKQNDSYQAEEKRMSELVQILNQGLKNFDQNNRGTIRDNFNDFPLKANLKDYEIEDRRFLDPKDHSPALFKASESAIRYNDSRLLDYEEPLELKYNSFDYQNRDSYGKTYQPLMEKERLYEENRRIQSRDPYNRFPESQSLKTLQNENAELTRKYLAQGAIIRNLETENSDLRQELNKLRGSQQSFKPYDEARDQAYAERKKLIADNEKLISQISDERREKNQLQNLLNMKASEVRELSSIKEKLAAMEIELNKKTEAVLTLSNLLRTEKMKNGELINDYRTLELAYQKLQMNTSPPSMNTNYSDLKNELRNNNNFVPQFGGSIQNQNNNLSLNQSQAPTNPIQNQMQTNTQEPIYYQQQSQTFGKPQTQTQSLNQSQIQSNSQVQTQSYPQNQSSVQGQGLYQPNIQNHNQSGGQNQVSSIPQANNQAQTSSQIQPQLQTQEMSQPNTQNQISPDTQAQAQIQGQAPATTQTVQPNPIFNQSQFPPLSELPEAVRIALQGSIKTLLQVQSTSPIKSSGAQSNAQTSASPSTTATSKKK